jgi:uncharacterized protein YwgA
MPDIDVIVYEPSHVAVQPNTSTDRPKMTPGRAALLALLDKYLNAGFVDSASNLEVQKLMYFMQVAGEPLKLHYSKYMYGPYADNLRQVLNYLNGHYLRVCGDSSSPETTIELEIGAVQDANIFLHQNNSTLTRLQRVASRIRRKFITTATQ